MAIKRNKPEEIVTKLRQVEVLVGQGKARIDAIRHCKNKHIRLLICIIWCNGVF